MDVTRKLGLAGIGVIDEVMEWWDEKEGRTEPFRNAKDIARIIEVGLGTLVEIFWPRYARWGSIMSDGAIPLLVKSMGKPIRQRIASAAVEKTYIPRRRAPAPAAGPPGIPAQMSQPIAEEEPVITTLT